MRNNIDNAICLVLEKEFNNYCNELEAAMESEPHIFSEKFCNKMDKLIRHSKRPWYSMVSTPMKKVAVIIIAILVFSLTSVMSIRAAREAVIGFFIQVYETFSVVFFGEDNANEEAPEGRTITEPMPDYEITALPEGYRLVYSASDEWSVDKWYENAEGEKIKFSYMVDSQNYIVLDTEDTASQICEIENVIYEYITEDIFTHFVWTDNGYVFSLKAENFDIAKAIASSISIKK